MRFIKSMYICAAVIPLGGCGHIHPVQQDVTQLKTIDIVNHIKCETKHALLSKVINLLDRYEKKTHSISTARLIEKLTKNPDAIGDKNIADSLGSPEEKKFYDKYIKSSIAFDFMLDITEENNAVGNLDALAVVSKGTFKSGLSVGGDLKRENVRSFLVVASFQEILALKSCYPSSLGENQNYIYPISGSIGITELIDTFIDLNELGSELGLMPDAGPALAKDSSNNTPVFADALTFTTTFNGGVTPTITLGPATPASHGLRLLDASLPIASANNQRIDKHNLIIGLALHQAVGAPARAKKATPGVQAPVQVEVNVKKTPADLQSKDDAVEAVARLKLDLYLSRTVGQ